MLKRNTGGNWRFNLTIEATESEIDDTLYVYSPINTTSTVSFKLYNKNSSPDDFMTYFTADSDPEFSITPKMGSFSSSLNDP